jgi:hypothetical protein
MRKGIEVRGARCVREIKERRGCDEKKGKK